MIIDETNFLNWPQILISEVIGSVMLFIIIGIIIIAILSLQNRVPFSTMFMLMTVWILICMTIAYNAGILALLMILVGTIVYLSYIKMIEGR